MTETGTLIEWELKRAQELALEAYAAGTRYAEEHTDRVARVSELVNGLDPNDPLFEQGLDAWAQRHGNQLRQVLVTQALVQPLPTLAPALETAVREAGALTQRAAAQEAGAHPTGLGALLGRSGRAGQSKVSGDLGAQRRARRWHRACETMLRFLKETQDRLASLERQQSALRSLLAETAAALSQEEEAGDVPRGLFGDDLPAQADFGPLRDWLAQEPESRAHAAGLAIVRQALEDAGGEPDRLSRDQLVTRALTQTQIDHAAPRSLHGLCDLLAAAVPGGQADRLWAHILAHLAGPALDGAPHLPLRRRPGTPPTVVGFEIGPAGHEATIEGACDILPASSRVITPLEMTLVAVEANLTWEDLLVVEQARPALDREQAQANLFLLPAALQQLQVPDPAPLADSTPVDAMGPARSPQAESGGGLDPDPHTPIVDAEAVPPDEPDVSPSRNGRAHRPALRHQVP